MKVPDYKEFVRAVAERSDQPATPFDALRALTEAIVGVKFFTVMTYDQEYGFAQRIYANPDAYPVPGTTPANVTVWSRHEGKRIFMANDLDAIARVFDAYELIPSLGCELLMNVPVVVAGEAKGTINRLHEAQVCTEEKVETAGALKLPGALCLLLSQRNRPTGAL